MAAKKIALVITNLKGNGAERFVITLASQLIEQGHHCQVFCFNPLQELASSHAIPVHIFPMNRYRWIPRQIRGRWISKLLDRFILNKLGTPDLVLSNLLPVDRIMSASRLPNVYLVIHSISSRDLLDFDNEDKKQQRRQQLSNIYCNKPAVCVSQGALEDFKQSFPCHQSATRIYNPVDPHFIKTSAEQPNPVNIPHYLVHVGKFKSSKRHDLLLKAYAESGVTLPLVLVGQGSLEASISALATKLGITERVIFAGFHQNPYPIMAGATAMLMTSDFEGLGLVILEALVLGVPVISTDCPSGPREILPQNNLVPTNDPAALADKIMAVTQHPGHFKIPLDPVFMPDTAVTKYLALINQH